MRQTLPPVISLIVARAANGVIGQNGALPWRLPADLQFFKATTMGKPLIMGRKTYQSIGKALPGRRNIVISRNPDFRAADAEVVTSFDAALKLCRDAAVDEVMVIGGAEIYGTAMPMAQRIYLTQIHRDYDGDTFLAAPDSNEWAEVSHQDHAATEEAPAFSFITFERR